MNKPAELPSLLTIDHQGPAIEFDSRQYDWDWMRAVIRMLDEALDRGGVSRDAPVGIVARNRPAHAAAILGLIAGSRSISMIYAFQSSTALAADIERLGLEALVADISDWAEPARVAAARTGTVAIGLQHDANEPVSRLEGLDQRGPGPFRAQLPTPAVEMLTSGTTGAPKRIPISFDLIAKSMIGQSTVKGDHIPERRTPVLLQFPFGNIAGLYSYLPMAASGTPVVLVEKFSVQAWRDFVRTHKPAYITLPPAGVRMVLDARTPPEDLRSLDFVYSGSTALDPSTHREFEETYGMPILLGYGATEFGGPVANMTLALHREFGSAKFGSVGRAWGDCELRVIDNDTGAILPSGEVGVLEVKAPRISQEWVRTTDLALIDQDGFMYHRGRNDGAIMRGGFKVMPETVVAALLTHPSVADAAVVPLQDARLGQVPVAAVQLRADVRRPTEEDIVSHLRATLLSTQIPAQVKIVPELPRTPSLKISLPAVRALFDA